MKDVIEGLYNYVLEYRYSSIVTQPEYQCGKATRDREAANLEETLTAEQRKQFRLYVEHADELENISLLYMFREALALMRDLLTI